MNENVAVAVRDQGAVRGNLNARKRDRFGFLVFRSGRIGLREGVRVYPEPYPFGGAKIFRKRQLSVLCASRKHAGGRIVCRKNAAVVCKRFIFLYRLFVCA